MRFSYHLIVYVVGLALIQEPGGCSQNLCGTGREEDYKGGREGFCQDSAGDTEGKATRRTGREH